MARPVLITGGAGFIGSNLANRLLADGREVLLFDNLSRPGVERNLQWLQQRWGTRANCELADIRDEGRVRRAVGSAGTIFHFAAQGNLATSLSTPLHDFDVNARGTVILLEAMRAQRTPSPLIFASSSKVYGALPDVSLQIRDGRHEPVDAKLRSLGVNERRLLDFHGPGGCSKGAADQYVLDYARTLGLQTMVFRLSCVYGPRQMGSEEQGWVSHFLQRALCGQPITIYGDGGQVRDLLYIDDLVEALLLAETNVATLTGQAFNIGGGPKNATSLQEMIALVTRMLGKSPAVRTDTWRPSDQRWYVSDTRRFQQVTGWAPRVTMRQGVERLCSWLGSNVSAAPVATRSQTATIAHAAP